ncbi:hypothetical protein GLOTRDRAFT_50245, partial [Gloeophyllum trabeum ATCC 11539]
REQLKEQEYAKTITRAVMSSTHVTFGAGLTVSKISTGFETCSILIKSLPPEATEKTVETMLCERGLDPRHFQVLWVRSDEVGRHQSARVICSKMAGAMEAVKCFNIVKAELSTVKTSRPEMNPSAQDCEVLTLSWPEPNAGALVYYTTEEEARRKVGELNGTLCRGRKVCVANAADQRVAGRTLKNFVPSAVTINGLPVDITVEAIQAFAGGFSVRMLKGRGYSLDHTHEFLHSTMERLGGLQQYSIVKTGGPDGTVQVKARFQARAQAKEAYDHFTRDPKPQCIGGAKLRASLPIQYSYSLYIPRQQYVAQQSLLDGLATEYTNTAAAKLAIHHHAPDKPVRLSIMGDEPKATGTLKVRLERISEGNRCDLWDATFASPKGFASLLAQLKDIPVYVRPDNRLRILRIFGTPVATAAARTKIEAEVHRLASLDYTVHLKKHSVGFFVREGLASLKELVGENNVKLNVTASPATIVIRGGDDARHALRRLINQSLGNGQPESSSQQQCPICFDAVSNPFALACGHAYCSGCLRHFLSTAGGIKQFPLQCLGDEGQCKEMISIPTVEQFLRPAELDTLLEAVFQTYLDQHPDEFRYCTTPDCSQIYRLATSGTQPMALQCPSCLTSVCTAGHEDHPGQTCEEWKLHRDPAEQERLLNAWAETQGAKSCPSCKTIIEKNGGCNHIYCRCGVHICWKCMGTFPDGEIYTHLNAVHGGHTDFV